MLYTILWTAGAIVSVAIILLWNRGESAKMPVFNNMDEPVTTGNATGNIVNELLLSANELNIYGKSSLIGYTGNDSREDAGSLVEQIKINPGKAYQQILKDKLGKIEKQQASDFRIKPVPK